MVQHTLRARVAAAACLVAGFAGCNDSGSGGQEPAGNFTPGAEVPVRLVDCKDWRGADPRERSRTVAAIAKFAGGRAGGPDEAPAGYGATMKDDSAYQLFDSYCAERFASRFKLYKLYTRAAAFGAR